MPGLHEGSDARFDPFGLLKYLKTKFSFDYNLRPIIWTWRRFWFVRWHHNDPGGAMWRAHRERNRDDYGPEKPNQPLDGPSDPVGWLSISFTPAFYIVLNLPLFGGKMWHMRYGGRFMLADHRTPNEHGMVERPSIAAKLVEKAFVW